MVLCRPREQRLMPPGTTIIGFTTSGAIASRNQIAEKFVAASTLPLQGPRIVSFEHVLQCKHAKKAAVAGAVMAMEIIIRIVQRKKSLICCCTLPPHLRSEDWIV